MGRALTLPPIVLYLIPIYISKENMHFEHHKRMPKVEICFRNSFIEWECFFFWGQVKDGWQSSSSLMLIFRITFPTFSDCIALCAGVLADWLLWNKRALSAFLPSGALSSKIFHKFNDLKLVIYLRTLCPRAFVLLKTKKRPSKW